MNDKDTVLGWHWTNGKTLRDGRPLPADGEVLRHDGPVEIRKSGLHFSERCLDALSFAPGSIVHRVECRNVLESQYDKSVCRERVSLWRIDASDILMAFARRCALDALTLFISPSVLREYLTTANASIRNAAHLAALITVNDANIVARESDLVTRGFAVRVRRAAFAAVEATNLYLDCHSASKAAHYAAWRGDYKDIQSKQNDWLEAMILEARQAQ